MITYKINLMIAYLITLKVSYIFTIMNEGHLWWCNG